VQKHLTKETSSKINAQSLMGYTGACSARRFKNRLIKSSNEKTPFFEIWLGKN